MSFVILPHCAYACVLRSNGDVHHTESSYQHVTSRVRLLLGGACPPILCLPLRTCADVLHTWVGETLESTATSTSVRKTKRNSFVDRYSKTVLVDVLRQGDNKQPVTIFSWEGQCCGRDEHPHVDMAKPAIFGDWAERHNFWKDMVIFPMSPDGEDKYHCGPACQIYNEESFTGDLFITISTWLSYGSIE
eukprot:7303455-Pyramimonas_sp.AAC.1